MDFFIETSSIVKSNISFLDESIYKNYFKNKGIEINEENKEFLLETSRIISRDKENGEFNCTLGGLLVFSNVNSLWLPHNIIRINNKLNINKDEVIIVQGNVLNMIDKASREVSDILPKDYPINAVIEAINNAVLYRDYSVFDKMIDIYISNKEVIITSPGAITGNSISINNINQSKRNMWLYEKLITIDNNKRFLNNGQGFVRIKKAFNNSRKVKFINSIKEDYFKVVLPGIKLSNK